LALEWAECHLRRCGDDPQLIERVADQLPQVARLERRYPTFERGLEDRDGARAKGTSGYIDNGTNCWSAVHRLDAARLVRLTLEGAPAGSSVHAVAEPGIATRAIAEAIGAELGVPAVTVSSEDASEHFGWIGRFFSADATASNTITRSLLGWEPTHQGLLEDLSEGHYFR
jgi:nucleoside-diphosphate-sugar epimerase